MFFLSMIILHRCLFGWFSILLQVFADQVFKDPSEESSLISLFRYWKLAFFCPEIPIFLTFLFLFANNMGHLLMVFLSVAYLSVSYLYLVDLLLYSYSYLRTSFWNYGLYDFPLDLCGRLTVWDTSTPKPALHQLTWVSS